MHLYPLLCAAYDFTHENAYCFRLCFLLDFGLVLNFHPIDVTHMAQKWMFPFYYIHNKKDTKSAKKVLFKIVENRASQNLTLATTASVVRASATWERGDWEGGGAVSPQCLSGATSTKKIVKKCKKPTGYFNNKNTVFHKFLMIIIMDGNIKFLKTSQFIISLISFFNYLWFGMVWLIYWSRVDKRHMKFVVSIPLNAAQGSHS